MHYPIFIIIYYMITIKKKKKKWCTSNEDFMVKINSFLYRKGEEYVV